MKTIIEILIDNSNSMGPYEVEKNNGEYLLPDGSTRMSLARKILKDEIIPHLDYASNIKVRKFHSITPLDQATDLQIDSIYEAPLEVEVLKQVIDKIEDPKNTGGTPITDAIKYSLNELSKYSDWDRKIILVTDGQETGKGDYKKAAKETMDLYGIPCKIFTVGIQQSAEAELKAKELAEETGGSYVNLKVTNYNKETVQSKLRPLLTKMVNQSVENIIQNPKPIVETEYSSQPTKSVTNTSTYQTVENFDSFEETAKPKNNLEKKDKNENGEITTSGQLNSALLETVKNNSEVLLLVNKQIASLQEDITELKNIRTDYHENEEITIRENVEEQNRVGRKAEQYLNDLLSERYHDRLSWLNKEGEQGGDHDFEVKDVDGDLEFYIECKGTKTNDKFFYLTKNEWHFFLQNTKNYRIYFIRNLDSNPEVIKIDYLLDWILNEKIVPYSDRDRGVKKDRIMMTIL